MVEWMRSAFLLGLHFASVLPPSAKHRASSIRSIGIVLNGFYSKLTQVAPSVELLSGAVNSDW